MALSEDEMLSAPTLTSEPEKDPVARAYGSFGNKPITLDGKIENTSFGAEVTKPVQELFRQTALMTGRGYEAAVKDYDMLNAADGDEDFETIEKRYEPGRAQALRDQEIDIISANWENRYGSLGRLALDTPGMLAEAIGQISPALPVGAGTATVAGGVTLATGVGAPVAGPMAAFGGSVGFSTFVGKLAKGRQYETLRKLGHDHDTARDIASAGGFLEGLTYAIPVHTYGKMAGKAFETALLNPATQRTFARMAESFVPQALMSGVQAGAITGVVELEHVIGEWFAEHANKPPITKDEIAEAVKSFALRIASSTPRLAEAAAQGARVGTFAGAAVRGASYAGAGSIRAAGKIPAFAQSVDGLINEVYANRSAKRQALKQQQVEKGLRKEPKLNLLTPLQRAQIKQNFATIQQAQRQQMETNTQTVIEAVRNGTKLAPDGMKREATLFGRTGMMQGVIPVPGEMKLSPVGGTTANSPWTSIKNTLLQFTDKKDLAGEILSIADEDMSYRQNVATMNKYLYEVLTNDADPYLLDALVTVEHRSAKAKQVAEQYKNSQGSVPQTAQQNKIYEATITALESSDDVRMELFAQMENPKNRLGLITKGYTFSGPNNSYDVIKSSLSAEHMEFIKNIKQRYYKPYHARASDGNLLKTGEDLPQDPEYSGHVQREGMPSIDDAPFLVAQEHFTKSLKEAKGGPTAIELGPGLIKSAMAYTRAMEFYFAMEAKARQLNHTIDHPEFKQAVKDTLGIDFYNDIKRMRDHQMGMVQEKKFNLDPLAHTYANYVMTGNVMQFPKQLVSGLMGYAAYVPFPMIVDSARRVVIQDPAVARFVKDSKSKYIRREGFSQELAEAWEMKDPRELLDLDKEMTFTELFRQPTKVPDNLHTTIGGFAVYEHFRKQNMPHEEAVLLADRIIEEHQSSSLKSQKTLAELEKGPTFTMLTKANVQSAKIMKDAQRRVLNASEIHDAVVRKQISSGATPAEAKAAARKANLEDALDYGQKVLAVKAMQNSFRIMTAGAAIATLALVGADSKKVNEAVDDMLIRSVLDLGVDSGMPFFGGMTDMLLTNQRNWYRYAYTGEKGEGYAFAPSTAVLDLSMAFYKLQDKVNDIFVNEPGETPKDRDKDLVQAGQYFARSVQLLVPKLKNLNVSPIINLVLKRMKVEQERSKKAGQQ